MFSYFILQNRGSTSKEIERVQNTRDDDTGQLVNYIVTRSRENLLHSVDGVQRKFSCKNYSLNKMKG